MTLSLKLNKTQKCNRNKSTKHHKTYKQTGKILIRNTPKHCHSCTQNKILQMIKWTENETIGSCKKKKKKSSILFGTAEETKKITK